MATTDTSAFSGALKKNVNILSKLTKGAGEFTDIEKREVEIVLDDNVSLLFVVVVVVVAALASLTMFALVRVEC